MKKTRVAINGFGRIGRSVFKVLFENHNIDIVAINDLSDAKTLAYLLKHDSNYGLYHREVIAGDSAIEVSGHKISLVAVREPADLPWGALGVDIVVESTGRFTSLDDASLHIRAGARKVVVSAAVKGDDSLIGNYLIGVNDDQITGKEDVYSNQSCTTNCITPIASLIDKHLGISKSLMTTVHAYTASQSLQDAPSKDVREGRNGAENIVPTTTNATVAATKILPSLKGNFLGLSIRVPVPVVSIADFTMIVKKQTSVDEINDILSKASREPRLKHILGVTKEQLVSSDFIGNPHSAVVDQSLTQVVGGDMIKIVAWYDNEWGYSNRLAELVAKIANKI